jgi:hypothetical protein
MQMVLPWDSGIGQYQSGFEEMQPESPPCCPVCGCKKFHRWGKYERYVEDEKGYSRICVRRIRCVKCGKTHSYLPSFCVSKMSCSTDFVMAVLKAFVFKLRISLEERQRWAYALWRRFRESESLFLTFLRAKGFRAFSNEKQARTRRYFEDC